MSCIVWNDRGLGNQRAFRELKRLCAEKSPTLLFISETKVRTSRYKWWREVLGFTGMFGVDCNGRSGGLLIIWKEPFDVTIHFYTSGHIYSTIKHDNKLWRFTGFYGHPDYRLRNQSWMLLRRLKDQQEFQGIPWLVGGDFNEICYDSEKLGGNTKPYAQTQAFRDILYFCSLQDLHHHGEFFKWVNRRQLEEIIFECLDRYVGTYAWRMMYPAARAHSLEFYHLDHRPIIIELGSTLHLPTFKRRLFRFETHWITEPDCFEIVEKGWQKENEALSL
ncbi:uncharacterized protein [Henckelia pumila]|uniref:uncharacterized protein n=1 Tax=Henckelia pumila TaxID=405737 RepID=UPI003C6E0A53